jgi:hypothetical protein
VNSTSSAANRVAMGRLLPLGRPVGTPTAEKLT